MILEAPPPPTTQLDPLETNPTFPVQSPQALPQSTIPDPSLPDDPALHPDVNFRHSGWQPTRIRVFRALQAAGVSSTRLEAFRNCGRHAWVKADPDDLGRYHVTADHCHDRFCLPCGQARSRTIARNVLALIDGKQSRFITLTLRGNLETLGHTLARLHKSFSRLRNRALWKKTQLGGVAFLEVKLRKDNQSWNAHLHVLTHGRYIDSRKLSNLWRKITGDSFIVDVRLVRNEDQATKYVTKYASKPLDPTVTHNPQKLAEAVTELAGTRLAWTFGDWRGEKLTDPPPPKDWIPVAPLSVILADAAGGDPGAIAIIAALRRSPKCPNKSPPTTDPVQLLIPGIQASL